MELTKHKTNTANEALSVAVLDKAGHGGAHHLYRIAGFNTTTNLSENRRTRPDKSVALMFQNGPIGDVGVNGITDEALLAVLIHRREGLQAGPYATKHGAAALEALESAMTHLQARTLERQARGVEGTHGL